MSEEKYTILPDTLAQAPPNLPIMINSTTKTIETDTCLIRTRNGCICGICGMILFSGCGLCCGSMISTCHPLCLHNSVAGLTQPIIKIGLPLTIQNIELITGASWTHNPRTPCCTCGDYCEQSLCFCCNSYTFNNHTSGQYWDMTNSGYRYVGTDELDNLGTNMTKLRIHQYQDLGSPCCCGDCCNKTCCNMSPLTYFESNPCCSMQTYSCCGCCLTTPLLASTYTAGICAVIGCALGCWLGCNRRKCRP